MFDVLLIDGDPERRELVAHHLTDLPGVNLVQAAPEIASVRLVQETPPRVVLIGIDEPDVWFLPLLKDALNGVPLLGYSSDWQPATEWSFLQTGGRRLSGDVGSRSTFLTAILEAARTAA